VLLLEPAFRTGPFALDGGDFFLAKFQALDHLHYGGARPLAAAFFFG
jgi:hypothetical protein